MKDKPRIYFRAGYWRVSPFPSRYFDRTYETTKEWMKAHSFTNTLNEKLYAPSNPFTAGGRNVEGASQQDADRNPHRLSQPSGIRIDSAP